MIEQTPEQRARAAVLAARPKIMLDGKLTDTPIPMTEGEHVALDRLCTERYLAGKVAQATALPCSLEQAEPKYGPMRQQDGAARRLATQFCWRCTALAEAEAEYAACVAALREAK